MIEVIAEKHANLAGVNYIRNQLDSGELTSGSTVMLEQTSALNGVFEALVNDEITGEELTTALDGYFFYNSTDVDNWVDLMYELKENDIKVVAYDAGYAIKALESGQSTLDEYVQTKQDRIEKLCELRDKIISPTNATPDESAQNNDVSSEDKSLSNDFNNASTNDEPPHTLSKDDLANIQHINERIATIEESIELITEHYDKSSVAKQIDIIAAQELVEGNGECTRDGVTTEFISKSDSTGKILVHAGEAHVVFGNDGVGTEGLLDENLRQAVGHENVTVTSVRDSMDGWNNWDHYKIEDEQNPLQSEEVKYSVDKLVVVDPESWEMKSFDNPTSLQAQIDATNPPAEAQLATTEPETTTPATPGM